MLQFKGYFGVYEIDIKNNKFVGRLAGISDNVTFEGENVAILKENFCKAVMDYSKSEDAQKPFRGIISVHIEPSVQESLFMQAVRDNISMSEYCSRIISNAVKKRQETDSFSRVTDNEGVSYVN